MRFNEFITESAKLWGAKVRVNQPNYVGYVDAQVWASSAQIARTILKQQYNIQDHHVGSVKEIKMRAKHFTNESIVPMKPGVKSTPMSADKLAQQMDKLGNKAKENPIKTPAKKPANLPPGYTIKEANYTDPDFNPRVERARIANLKIELADANFSRRQEIAKEIKQIEAQLRLWQATQPVQTSTQEPKKTDEGSPYTIYYDGQVSGRMIDTTIQGAKNVGKRTVMQQQAHTFAIVTDNAGNVVFAWYPGGHERPYEVGDKYNAPGAPNPYKDRPRYPAGHPHAGAPMPAKIPVVTDWSKLPDGGLEAWMQGKQEPEAGATAERPEVYMGQAQRVDQQQKLKKNEDRKSIDRIAELAGLPGKKDIDEGMNPQLGKILELANRFAVAIANMKIYKDDIFANHLKFGGLGNIVDGIKKIYTDQDYASGQREAAQLKQQLGQMGVKIDYSESFPTEFTLSIPEQSKPYTFDLVKLLKDAMSAVDTKEVK